MAATSLITEWGVFALCILAVLWLATARSASATTCEPGTGWITEFNSIEQVDGMELDEELLGDERRNWSTNSTFDQSNTDVPEYNILYGYAEGALLLRPREP